MIIQQSATTIVLTARLWPTPACSVQRQLDEKLLGSTEKVVGNVRRLEFNKAKSLELNFWLASYFLITLNLQTNKWSLLLNLYFLIYLFEVLNGWFHLHNDGEKCAALRNVIKMIGMVKRIHWFRRFLSYRAPSINNDTCKRLLVYAHTQNNLHYICYHPWEGAGQIPYLLRQKPALVSKLEILLNLLKALQSPTVNTRCYWNTATCWLHLFPRKNIFSTYFQHIAHNIPNLAVPSLPSPFSA